jgi:cytoskeletal protein CcmA (bactofilin family)
MAIFTRSEPKLDTKAESKPEPRLDRGDGIDRAERPDRSDRSGMGLRGDPGTSTTVAVGTRIRGEIQVECDGCTLNIDGTVSGTITSRHVVHIGKTGVVDGEIVAKKLTVLGAFEGNADCDEIEILEGGRITGQMVSGLLVIERGSRFAGESRLKERPGGPGNTGSGAGPEAMPGGVSGRAAGYDVSRNDLPMTVGTGNTGTDPQVQ